MSSQNPGLARAVAEVTQPFGSPATGDVLRSLQKYLQDKKSVDNVYKALVLRAWAEPLSQAVFDKVVSIFKQCLLRHTPSLDVLELLDEFCTALPRALPLPPSSMKAVQYTQACVCRAYDNCVAQQAANSQRPMTAEKRLPTMHDRPPSASRLPPRTRTPSSANNSMKPPTPSILAGMGGGVTGGGVVGVVGKQQQQLQAPGVPKPEVLELHSRPSSAQVTRAPGLPGYGGGSGRLMRPSCSSLDSEAEAKLLTTPSWAIQGAATHLGLLDDGQLPQQVDGLVDTSWVGHVPELNPSLTPAPYGEEPSLLLLDEEAEQEGTRSTEVPLSATSLARCILDVDEERVEEHLLDVSLALKLQLDAESKASTGSRKDSHQPGGRDAPLMRPNSAHARMLFSHQPYSQQEALNMNQADVAVVVEVVCGRGAAKAFGTEAPGAGSAGAKPWCESFDEGDLGQVCGSILMKLVMDLFLNAGPGTSYPLVLRMLRQALASPQPKVRARAFDVVFNLALHSALLEPNNPDLLQKQPPQQQQQQQQQHGMKHELIDEGEAPPLQDQSTKHGQMMCWLRALCMQLLAEATEADESSEEVWQAALGCFLHLTTFKGYFVESWAIHTPLDAMSGMLCACVMFGWSPDLYAHLLRLASMLLVKHTPSAAAVARDAAAADRAVVEAWAHGGRQQPQQPKLTPRLGGVPEEFGGLQEVLRHLSLAPTPAARADLLGVILHFLSPDASVTGALTRTIHTRGLTPFTAALQVAVACPRPGVLALRLASSLAGQAPFGPTGHGFPPGHARNHSQGRGLYFGSSPAYGFGQNPLVGAGSAPNPASNTIVNNWLSIEAMRFNAGGGSHANTLRSSHFGAGSISPNALPPPIAELLLAFLSSLEEAVVLPVQLCMKSPEVGAQITLTLEHIAPGNGGPPQGGMRDPAAFTAAWEALRAACLSVEGVASSASDQQQHADNRVFGGLTKGAGEPAGRRLSSSGEANRRRRACASITRLPASGGQLALHWLHQVLLQAFLVCQHAPLLLSPNTLRSPTSARQALAGTFGSTNASGTHSPPPLHEDRGAGARAAASAAVAAAARSGVPGTFGSPPLHGSDSLGGAGDNGKVSPKLGSRTSSGQNGSPGRDQQQQTQLAAAWTSRLASVLSLVVREVPSGGHLLVAVMARVVSDLKQGISSLQSRMEIVMAAHYVTLQWLLQSGSQRAQESQAAIQELSDQVLHSLTQPLGPEDTPPRGSRSGGGNQDSQGNSIQSSAQRSFDDLPATGKAIRSHNLQVSCSFDVESSATAASTVPQLNPHYVHCHIARAILTSQAGFVPEVLRAAPPELLVSLLQHCIQAHVGGSGVARGFMGRTSPSSSSMALPQDGLAADGVPGHPRQAQPPPTWGDVAMDRRLALLLSLMACCGLDPEAFTKYGLSHVIKSGLMSSTDPRERYYAGVYMLRHLQLNQQDKYWRSLRALLLQAQQLNDERMIDNPYLTAASMLQSC